MKIAVRLGQKIHEGRGSMEEVAQLKANEP
jgi:hypothetical protein